MSWSSTIDNSLRYGRLRKVGLRLQPGLSHLTFTLAWRKPLSFFCQSNSSSAIYPTSHSFNFASSWLHSDLVSGSHLPLLLRGPRWTFHDLNIACHLPSTHNMANEEQRKAFAAYMGGGGSNSTTGAGQPIPQYPGSVTNPASQYLFNV